jgi:hypothetical protein
MRDEWALLCTPCEDRIAYVDRMLRRLQSIGLEVVGPRGSPVVLASDGESVDVSLSSFREQLVTSADTSFLLWWSDAENGVFRLRWLPPGCAVEASLFGQTASHWHFVLGALLAEYDAIAGECGAVFVHGNEEDGDPNEWTSAILEGAEVPRWMPKELALAEDRFDRLPEIVKLTFDWYRNRGQCYGRRV